MVAHMWLHSCILLWTGQGPSGRFAGFNISCCKSFGIIAQHTKTPVLEQYGRSGPPKGRPPWRWRVAAVVQVALLHPYCLSGLQLLCRLPIFFHKPMSSTGAIAAIALAHVKTPNLQLPGQLSRRQAFWRDDDTCSEGFKLVVSTQPHASLTAMSSTSSKSSTITAPPPPGFVTASGHTLSGPKFATVTPPAHRKPDLLDKSVTFLAKRDGIDKVCPCLHLTGCMPPFYNRPVLWHLCAS